MDITLTPELQKFVDRKVQDGDYSSAEELIRAGIERLMHDDFVPGELAALIAVGEAELQRGDVVDGDTVFKELRAMRQQRAPG